MRKKAKGYVKSHMLQLFEVGHFSTNSPEGKRKGKQHASVANVDDDQPQDKKEKESQLDKVAKSIRK